MLKPSKYLLLAQFAHKDTDWAAVTRGLVISRDKSRVFDISTKKDRNAVIAKLNLQGWDIRPVKRSGQGKWLARHKSGTEIECPVVGSLLADIVERVKAG